MAQVAPPKSEQTDNLTGSLITLITNAQVRYEGTLIEINRAERSMNLSNVRSFGTEGRRDGKNEIQPHENIIQSVVFKVDHVKDFQIIKRPDAISEPEPKEDLQEQDPAIISSEQQQQRQQQQEEQVQQKPQHQARPYGGGPPSSHQSNRQGGGERRQQHPQQQQHPQSRELEQWQGAPEDDPKMRMDRGDRGDRGGHHTQQSRRGGRQQSRGGPNLKMGEVRETPNTALQAKLKENFDFSQRSLEESKQASTTEEMKQAAEPEEESDDGDDDGDDDGAGFFDSFAKSGPEQRGRGGRGMRERVNQKDSDTFGAQSSQNFRYADNGRRGRGGHRGGRGGRGGGRGDNGGYQGRGGGGDGGYNNYSRGGYRGGGNRGGGGYYGGGGDNNYRRGGGRGRDYPRPSGDPLADARREQQHQQRQSQQQEM